MTREEEMKNKDNNNKEYEKDLNHLKERILKDGDTLVSKRDLLERFCEVDKEYDGSPWNLLQILTNIHILIGEEPCEDWMSRQVVSDFLEGHAKDFEDVSSVTPTRKKGKWIVEDSGNYNGKYSTCYCGNCKDYYTRNWREMNYCPNCGAEMESEE